MLPDMQGISSLKINATLPLKSSVAITEDIYAHVTANVMEEAALKIERQLFGR